MNSQPTTVTLHSDTEVKVARTFTASAHLVWRSYTEPDLLSRWMLGPAGWSMPVCEIDLRVGGTYRWRWRSVATGDEFGFHGVFLSIEPEVTLVHTQIFDPGTVGGNMASTALITVALDEADGETTVITLIRFDSIEDRDAAISTGMTNGMGESYRLLDKMLAERSPI